MTFPSHYFKIYWYFPFQIFNLYLFPNILPQSLSHFCRSSTTICLPIPPTKNFSLELTLSPPPLSLSLSERNVYIDHRAPLSGSVPFQLLPNKQESNQPIAQHLTRKTTREKRDNYTQTLSLVHTHTWLACPSGHSSRPCVWWFHCPQQYLRIMRMISM